MRKRQYIRVSELGDFTYCPVAWQLRKNGAPSGPQAIVEQDLGRTFHYRHARQVTRSESAVAMAPWLTAPVLLTGGILVLCLLAEC